MSSRSHTSRHRIKSANLQYHHPHLTQSSEATYVVTTATATTVATATIAADVVAVAVVVHIDVGYYAISNSAVSFVQHYD